MCANISMSTHSECGKEESHESTFDKNEEGSSDLTASDFEVLNSENFFDRINEAFQNFQQPLSRMTSNSSLFDLKELNRLCNDQHRQAPRAAGVKVDATTTNGAAEGAVFNLPKLPPPFDKT
jgi:hypothetical protein